MSASVMSLLSMKGELEDIGSFAGHKQPIVQTKGMDCSVRKGEPRADHSSKADRAQVSPAEPHSIAAI